MHDRDPRGERLAGQPRPQLRSRNGALLSSATSSSATPSRASGSVTRPVPQASSSIAPRREVADQRLPEAQVERRVVGVLEVVEVRVVPHGLRPGRGSPPAPARWHACAERTWRWCPACQPPAIANVVCTPPTEISTLAAMNEAAKASEVSAFCSAKTRPCSDVRHGVAEQQPVVHEREAVAEAAEDEDRQQNPQLRPHGAQRQVDRHAAEPHDVGPPPLERLVEARGQRAEHGAQAVGGDQRGEARGARAEHVAREDHLADVGHAREQHGGGRAGQQQAHVGAAARSALQADAQVGPQRAVLERARRCACAARSPASRRAERANEAALAPSRAAGGTTASRPAASAGPAVRPEVVERAEQAERRRPPVAGRQARDARQRGGREQRRAGAGQRGGQDQRRQRLREDDEREGEEAQQVGGDRARPPADAVDQRAEQRAEEDRRQQVGHEHRGHRPGGPGVLVGQQRQHHVGEPRAEARLCVGGEEPPARSVDQRGAQHSGPRGSGHPPAAGHEAGAADAVQQDQDAEHDHGVADAVDVVEREPRPASRRCRRGTAGAGRPSPPEFWKPPSPAILTAISGSAGMTPPLAAMAMKFSSPPSRITGHARDPAVDPGERAQQQVAEHVDALAHRLGRAGDDRDDEDLDADAGQREPAVPELQIPERAQAPAREGDAQHARDEDESENHVPTRIGAGGPRACSNKCPIAHPSARGRR